MNLNLLSVVEYDIYYGQVLITVENIYSLLPFKNSLLEIDLKGYEIKELLEESISNYLDNHNSTGSFPYGYGIKYDINITKSKNSRVSNIKIMNKKLENNKIYKLITISYLSLGKDGYAVLKNKNSVDTYLDYAMSFMNFIQKEKVLYKLPKSELPINCYIDEIHKTCPK